MYTKVDELFWKDTKLKNLTDDAKFVFFYVLTTPHRNVLGYYHLPKPYAICDLRWEEKRFTKAFHELLRDGFINYDSEVETLFIRNYLKYNPLENPNQVKGALTSLDKLPPSTLDIEVSMCLERLNKPLLKPLIERLSKSVTVTVPVNEDVDVNEDIPISNKNIFLSDSNEYRLADYLFKYILKNNEKAKEPNFQSWSKSFDLMLRIDNRTIDEIKAVIEFSQKDSFWMNNILSASKLREKFDQLYLNSKKKAAPKIDNRTSQAQSDSKRHYSPEEVAEMERGFIGR